jgi:hypothetical protein
LGAMPHVKKVVFVATLPPNYVVLCVCVSQTILLKQSLQKRRVYVS